MNHLTGLSLTLMVLMPTMPVMGKPAVRS